MSLEWASSTVNMQALLGEARMSQILSLELHFHLANLSFDKIQINPKHLSKIRYVLSTEQEARTLFSFGDHCKSSTDLVWLFKGRKSTCHSVSRGDQTWMLLLQSPVARTPTIPHKTNASTKIVSGIQEHRVCLLKALAEEILVDILLALC